VDRAGVGTAGSPGTGVPRVAQGTPARADNCDAETAQDQSLPPSRADGATIRAIKERGRLRVGVDQSSYRWGYRDPNNTGGDELEGFDIDLARRIARDILGDPDKVQFLAIPTNQRIPAIRSGQVDMVVRTMTISCDRMDEVLFSAPYFLTGQQVLAPKSSPVTGYDTSLTGRKICSADGSTAYKRLRKDMNLSGSPAARAKEIIRVPNQLDCLVRLQLGEVDAVVTDGALAASQAAQDPTVELKGKRFTTEYYGVAMAHTAQDLVRRVNQVLADYRRDGGWKAAYKEWLSPTMGGDSESARPPVARYR
jgi:polar amino acid transport system substrate-binding protein